MASRQNGRAAGLRLQNRPVFLSDRKRRPGHAVALTYANAVQAASLTLRIVIYFLTGFLGFQRDHCLERRGEKPTLTIGLGSERIPLSVRDQEKLLDSLDLWFDYAYSRGSPSASA